MNTRIMKIVSDVTAGDLSTAVVQTPKVKKNTYEAYEIVENQNDIKMLSINKKKNKMSTYFKLIIKRIIDIIASIVGCAILLPLTVIIYIANVISGDKGPIFYGQKRIGKNGKYFKMYKFRTMCVDSDEKLKELLKSDESARKEWEENRKFKNDPRITKIGKFLRKTSLDEWPQFLNVLLGQMSLIGPRAVIDGEIEKFGIYKKDVLSVKPGITGYWTANGRSNTTYEERVFMEHKYVREFSIEMDFKIFVKTVISVLKKEGAV